MLFWYFLKLNTLIRRKVGIWLCLKTSGSERNILLNVLKLVLFETMCYRIVCLLVAPFHSKIYFVHSIRFTVRIWVYIKHTIVVLLIWAHLNPSSYTLYIFSITYRREMDVEYVSSVSVIYNYNRGHSCTPHISTPPWPAWVARQGLVIYYNI